MKSIEESVVTALDGSDLHLFPFLPYILQDVWEIGSSPKIILDLLRKHIRPDERLNILDLGCGKGAVSITLAHELRCKCLGIDAMKEFIEEAKKRATDYNVSSLCTFETGDIRIRIHELSGFDVIILGSIGPVFGNFSETLSTILGGLNRCGIVVFDEVYIEDTSMYTHPQLEKKGALMRHISNAQMELLDEYIVAHEQIQASNQFIFERIEKRCHELIRNHPDKKELFQNYIRQQKVENDVLEREVICSTMLLRRQ